jgi:hypothetical protein
VVAVVIPWPKVDSQDVQAVFLPKLSLNSPLGQGTVVSPSRYMPGAATAAAQGSCSRIIKAHASSGHKGVQQMCGCTLRLTAAGQHTHESCDTIYLAAEAVPGHSPQMAADV